MARCMLGLGLPVSEVVAVQLDDLNWRDGTVRIGAGKSRRADVLPLPVLTGRAIAAYLRRLDGPVQVTPCLSAIRRPSMRTRARRTGPFFGSCPRTAGLRLRRVGSGTGWWTKWRPPAIGRASRIRPNPKSAWASRTNTIPWTPKAWAFCCATAPCRSAGFRRDHYAINGSCYGTAQQRDQLAPVWLRSFDKFGNWMGAYVTAEILGDRYADEAAFKTLDNLSRTARMPHRALAAYGLYKLARTVGEGQLHDRAIERLRTLAGSSVDEIRQEASEALLKLKKA